MRPRSPLAMVLLALLAEQPMHPYRAQQPIKSRRKDAVVNVARSNSVYQVIERLLREGLIRAHGGRQADSGPSRQVYEITKDGRDALTRWLSEMLAERAREYPEFRAGIATIGILEPSEVLAHLRQRVRVLEQDVTQTEADLGQATRLDLPRVLALEDEYHLTVTRAELEWLRTVVADLAAGTLSWSTDALVALSNRLEPR